MIYTCFLSSQTSTALIWSSAVFQIANKLATFSMGPQIIQLYGRKEDQCWLPVEQLQQFHSPGISLSLDRLVFVKRLSNSPLKGTYWFLEILITVCVTLFFLPTPLPKYCLVHASSAHGKGSLYFYLSKPVHIIQIFSQPRE